MHLLREIQDINMIKSFRLSNFCSFADSNTVSFEVGKSAPQDNRFVDLPDGTRVTKILGAFGPNASGKTRLLMGLAFLRWFATSSFKKIKANARIPFDPFLFGDKESRTEFEIEFDIDSIGYKYIVVLNSAMVFGEELKKKEVGGRYRRLIKRVYVEDKKIYDVKIGNINLDYKSIKPLLRKNASILSSSQQLESTGLENVYKFFYNIRCNVDIVGRMKWHDMEMDAVIRRCVANNKIKEKIEEILKTVDLGLCGLRFKKTKVDEDIKNKFPDVFKDKDDEIVSVLGVHEICGDEYELEFDYESDGTKELFKLLGLMVPVLENGGVAVIDELDLCLHPHMVEHIYDLFCSPTKNPRHAQLIFSTHAVDVMKLMDKSQILLVEKDKDTLRSAIWRLDEMKGVRTDDNWTAKYLSGSYGAIPDI